MAGKLTPEGLRLAAGTIGCDVPALRAVLAVEAAGDGFFRDGRPKILFERHIFHRLTQGRFDAVASSVSNVSPGGYKGGIAEYLRLYIAAQYDAEAACMSASWGIGQLMGMNWKLCGEKSLLGFLLAMHHDEDSQLQLMAQFIRSAGAADNLARHDWAGFARIYNGAGYSKTAYDTKLAKAYEQAVGAGL